MDGLLCIEIAMADRAPVCLSQWERLIEEDPELERIHETNGINPMTHKEMVIPYAEPAAVWVAHPDGNTGPPFVFAYEDGVIYSYTVDRAFVRKGRLVAEELGARLTESLD